VIDDFKKADIYNLHRLTDTLPGTFSTLIPPGRGIFGVGGAAFSAF